MDRVSSSQDAAETTPDQSSVTARNPPQEAALPAVPDVPTDAGDTENPNRPIGIRFTVAFACILMGDFFVGYDSSCVTTLTPVISDEFRAVDDVGWYGIAYILASASTILTFGQLYTMLPMKAVFLLSIVLFAIGAAVCAAAPNSLAFIVGRAISGLGSAGIFSGGNIILANITPLKDRPFYQSLGGGVECMALALGPLISGAIASASSWRVAFLIQVPIAACIVLAVTCLFRNPPQPTLANTDSKPGLHQLDLLGMVLFVPTNVCLILALQWGGSVYPWRDDRVVALMVLAALFAVAFGFAQRSKGDKAMFPMHLLQQRSVTLGAIVQFSVCACLFCFGFYLPIYFQAVRGASSYESGLMFLPTALSLGVAAFGAGNITTYIGYYTPVMLVGSTLLCVGAGLMTTLSLDTPPIQWIWFQILYAFGVGVLFQQSYYAVQTILPENDVATGIVCLSFAQEIGGIVALAVSQNVFLNLAVSRLTDIIPDLDPRALLDQGVVSLPKGLPERYREAVYRAYTKTIVDVFYIGLAFACLTILSLGIEWKSVKEEKKDGDREREPLLHHGANPESTRSG